MTRNFAIFLISIACIVLAVPFANRDDWLGWGASFTILVAIVAILGLYLAGIVRKVKDWRDGEF